ncbi:MAG TPA: type IV secretion system DNA-binding domain-containing protein [Patescibacteria group bacterium]|nr:type IV secretion system DNA-binding domain-containing protein [Patescibacteria group bacterium]
MEDKHKASLIVTLEVRTSRTGLETPESMVQFLANLTNFRKRLLYIFKKGIPISLEIGVIDQTIHFFISAPVQYQAFIESQLVSQYPKSMLSRVKDYVPGILSKSTVQLGIVRTAHNYHYPIRVFSDFKDVDPLSSLLGVLAKAHPGDEVSLQYLLLPIGQGWQGSLQRMATTKVTSADGTSAANPAAKVFQEKATSSGLGVVIRVAVAGATKERTAQLFYEISNSFSSYNNPSGNSLSLRKCWPWEVSRMKWEMLNHRRNLFSTYHIFNVAELATLYHFPGEKLATIPNIAWHKVILSQAPEDLPVAEGMSEEEKKNVNFFAKTEYKNKQTVFGIKREDRRRHVYVIGKSGTGKSTLIANMAINDLRNGEGFCIIDPHGDLCENILNYIPSYRVNDIIYLDPSDQERSFSINPLEVTEQNQKELVASGIVAIFKKLYGESWGPRLEYILRNVIVSIMEMPDATLLMVPEMLGNASFRAKVVERLTDPVLKSYWVNEFEKMTDRLRAESIMPIQNKVGQFTSSTRIRNIIGHAKSSIDIEKAMNEGKVLILNLSQGYLGEDNAALLGAMIITKIQLAAMNRVSIPEEQRRDFYLYVDEFQNFATTSFIKILSEARKFRLSLILANQYIAQVPEDVRAAIFGNAGTLMSFLVGAADAGYMAKEFSERFKEEDLLALGNHQVILKLYINGITQSPFHCYTLPLPKSRTQNREKVIKGSKERYTKPVIKSSK